ncbi:MAG: allophanate hydrolase [Bacteroidetes bacterium HGW-Bacteroidetes-2]|jgi:inhibitor of KinA|nr:MAG: allophanate hydrolase [Bacteroidetes bacterium HGW-Bacteroidetes-2]
MKILPKIEKFGENTILLRWKGEINTACNDEIIKINEWMNTMFHNKIIETVPSFLEIAIYVKPKVAIDVFMKQLQLLLKKEIKLEPIQKRFIYDIPVCYDEEFGLDMHEFSELSGFPIKKIIQLHTKPLYRVYFLGFLPGFPYLGGLADALFFPRKKEPRDLIQKGSVAIGGNQTGIYTIDSPGGWNILGRTPFYFFDATRANPSLLQAGDYVKFVSISKKHFQIIAAQIKEGTYILKRKIYND